MRRGREEEKVKGEATEVDREVDFVEGRKVQHCLSTDAIFLLGTWSLEARPSTFTHSRLKSGVDIRRNSLCMFCPWGASLFLAEAEVADCRVALSLLLTNEAGGSTASTHFFCPQETSRCLVPLRPLLPTRYQPFWR